MPVQNPPIRWFEGGAGAYTPTGNFQIASRIATAAICPDCQSPFGVVIDEGYSAKIFGLMTAREPDVIDSALRGATVTTIPTSKFEVKADVSIPELIREQFVYIQEDAIKRRNPAGIMSGARACLDVALKHFGETEGGRRARIKRLAERGIVTHGIAEWAQTLWEEGSDAVHDLRADIKRASDHVEFLKLFFEVAFALPARIAAASHGAVPADSSTDAA